MTPECTAEIQPCDAEECQACCEHEETDHGICLMCEHYDEEWATRGFRDSEDD